MVQWEALPIFTALIVSVAPRAPLRVEPLLRLWGWTDLFLFAANTGRRGSQVSLPLFQCLQWGPPLVFRVGPGGEAWTHCTGGSPDVIHLFLIFRQAAPGLRELQAPDKQLTSFQVSFPHFSKQRTLAAKTEGKQRHKHQFSDVSSYQVNSLSTWLKLASYPPVINFILHSDGLLQSEDSERPNWNTIK